MGTCFVAEVSMGWLPAILSCLPSPIEVWEPNKNISNLWVKHLYCMSHKKKMWGKKHEINTTKTPFFGMLSLNKKQKKEPSHRRLALRDICFFRQFLEASHAPRGHSRFRTVGEKTSDPNKLLRCFLILEDLSMFQFKTKTIDMFVPSNVGTIFLLKKKILRLLCLSKTCRCKDRRSFSTTWSRWLNDEDALNTSARDAKAKWDWKKWWIRIWNKTFETHTKIWNIGVGICLPEKKVLQ